MAEPIEGIVIQYLNQKLSEEEMDVTAYIQEPGIGRPDSDRDKYLIVQRSGSRRENHLYSSTIAVQSYAGSIYEAAKLNEKVIEIMDNITELDRITAVDLNSTYLFMKTSTKQPRYQAVFDLYHY